MSSDGLCPLSSPGPGGAKSSRILRRGREGRKEMYRIHIDGRNWFRCPLCPVFSGSIGTVVLLSFYEGFFILYVFYTLCSSFK